MKMKIKYIHALRRMAIDGDVDAMWILGEAYYNGYFSVGDNDRQELVPRNSRLACRWLLRASNKERYYMDLHLILLDMSVDSLVREWSARVALIAGTESSWR